MAVQKCFTCRICSHRLSSLLHGQTYKINDTILPTVESVRDLGVIVDHHLKFDAHISQDVRKAMIRSRLLLKCFFLSKQRPASESIKHPSMNTLVLFGLHILST